MDGISRSCGWISRSRGWDKEIPHCVLPMEQLVLSDKWARNTCVVSCSRTQHSSPVRLELATPRSQVELFITETCTHRSPQNKHIPRYRSRATRYFGSAIGQDRAVQCLYRSVCFIHSAQTCAVKHQSCCAAYLNLNKQYEFNECMIRIKKQ